MNERMSDERFAECKHYFDMGFPDWDFGDSALYFTEIWQAFEAERAKVDRLEGIVRKIDSLISDYCNPGFAEIVLSAGRCLDEIHELTRESDEFAAGWKACRKQVDVGLKEQDDG